MPLLAPPPLPSVTVPLGLVIPPGKEHYFDTTAEPVPYTRRSFEFRGERAFLPLVHAFLTTCAAGRDPDYAYLFRLLGVELATNAIRHTNSGRHGGTFTLHVVRTPTHMKLTCSDSGDGRITPIRDPEYLAVLPLDPEREHGRGLALVDALATSWGDDGRQSFRRVWFTLDYDLAGSAWPAL